jgi:primosomal protein N' (replication factor Y)
LRLPDRHGGAAQPQVMLVDLKKTPPPSRQSWLSPPLRDALAATLQANEQAMLFLNRRGYAPLTLCRTCGHRLQCPRCTAWLVEHRQAGRLQCHHCGYLATLPAECPECHARGSFAACGPGVERLAEEVAALHPTARVSILASDTLDRPQRVAEFVRAVEAREIDVLIGTQVVAKGHHFPYLTLVGVVDADLGLEGGELRAAEHTYQLLAQVAGRAGREALPGKVVIQTTQPNHPVMQALAAGDRDGFLAAEAAIRRARGWPPFGRLAALIVSGPHAAEVDRIAAALARAAPRGPGIEVLGPAPAPLALLRGRHRRRLLLKTARATAPQALLRVWLAAVAVPHAVRVQVDIDPYSFA